MSRDLETESAFEKYNPYTKAKKMIDVLYSSEEFREYQNFRIPDHIIDQMYAACKRNDATYLVLFSVEIVHRMLTVYNVPKGNIIFVSTSEYKKFVYENLVESLYVDDIDDLLSDPKFTVVRNFIQSLRSENKVSKDIFQKLVIIGNPPYNFGGGFENKLNYNEGEEKGTAKTVYHLFVEKAMALNPKAICMIVPSTMWQIGGRGVDSFRAKMVNDVRFRKIVHFPADQKVFENASPPGGVNWFYWELNNKSDGMCEINGVRRKLNEYSEFVILDDGHKNVLNKIKSKTSKTIQEFVSAQKPFSIDGKFFSFKESGHMLLAEAGQKKGFISSDQFDDKLKILNKYKVVSIKLTIESNGGKDKDGRRKIFTRVYVLNPGEVCTDTYIVLKTFSSKEEAENFAKYVMTKFFRFLLGIVVIGQHISRKNFCCVPDLENYNVEITDDYLNSYFDLDQSQIDLINSQIK